MFLSVVFLRPCSGYLPLLSTYAFLLIIVIAAFLISLRRLYCVSSHIFILFYRLFVLVFWSCLRGGVLVRGTLAEGSEFAFCFVCFWFRLAI